MSLRAPVVIVGALVLTIAGTVFPACGSHIVDPSDGAVEDAGPGDDVGPAFDGTIEGTVRTPNCIVASDICVGAELHTCASDTAADLITVCPDACSFGRCTSSACQDAEQSDALRGCRFYAVQVDNVDSEDSADMMLILTNSSAVPANAYMQVRSPAGDWITQVMDIVPAQGSTRMVRNLPVRAPGLASNAAFRIESDVPISVAELVSDNVDRDSTSSGGTVLLPVHALGRQYLAVTAQEMPSPQVTAAPGSRDGAGMIAVVGTVDRTTVTLTLPPMVTAVVGTVVMVTSSDPPYSIVIDEGDVLQVFSASAGDDLSGAEITADHPVEVLSGNTFTSYGHVMTGLNGADLAFEQMPPVETWGKRYIGAWLAPQVGCDAYFGAGVGSWQIIASVDNTSVTLSPANATMFSLTDNLIRLDRGESRRFLAFPDPSKIAPGAAPPPTDFFVEAAQPILLLQWLDCEPGLSLGIDARLGRGTTVVAFPPNFDNQMVLVRRAGANVTIDGQPVSDEAFLPVDQTGLFEAARIAEQDLGRPCVDLSDGCSHVIDGDGVGLTWRGMDIVCSYSTTLPSSDACVLPGVSCTE